MFAKVKSLVGNVSKKREGGSVVHCHSQAVQQESFFPPDYPL